MAAGRSPTVYVIAGPNGAGKTRFATDFLPEFVQCREFVNADLIAAGLSPFAPESQAMRAGRLLLIRIKELAEARQDFGFETTLAGRAYVRLISELRQSGCEVILFFLWLPTAEMAMARVAGRVRQGGHDVPETTITRRFHAGLRNFFKLYAPLVNSWCLYNGSQLPPELIADCIDGIVRVHQLDSYELSQTDCDD